MATNKTAATAVNASNSAPAATAQVSSILYRSVPRITGKNIKTIAIGENTGVKIAGIVRGFKMKADPMDNSIEYPAFSGSFVCIKGSEALISDELSMPSVPEGLLMEALTGAGKEASIIFSYTVYKMAQEGNPRGFVWSAKENKPTQVANAANDPIMQLV